VGLGPSRNPRRRKEGEAKKKPKENPLGTLKPRKKKKEGEGVWGGAPLGSKKNRRRKGSLYKFENT
jgi:hypothetical protein